jgi:hypothetical protein
MDTESEKKYILDNCSGSIYHQKEERENTALGKKTGVHLPHK